MIQELIEKAKQRHGVEKVIPLPGKNWEDCLIVPYLGAAIQLHYHVPGETTSRVVEAL